MTDFALYHVGDWRDGQGPNIKTAIYVVSHDQHNYAYQVDMGEYEAFADWVAIQWASENEPQDDDEDSTEYLDRIGVSVSLFNGRGAA